MATTAGIRRAFSALTAAGIPQPAAWQRGDDEEQAATLRAAVETWALVLADVEDADLLSAVIAWLRSPDARWWPSPGAVLAHRPPRAAAAPTRAAIEAGAVALRELRHDWEAEGREIPDWLRASTEPTNRGAVGRNVVPLRRST